MKNCIIIVGSSRGLGLEIAKLSLNSENYVVCLSKNKNLDLEKWAKNQNAQFEYATLDLQDAENVEQQFSQVLKNVNSSEFKSVTLVLNSGVITPIAPAEKLTLNTVLPSLHINLTSQILLISKFIAHVQDWPKEKRIIHVNSGAGMNPYFGWGMYCATKAGMKLFCECVAKEQKDKTYPVVVYLFSPGVIDTDMQTEIRVSDKKDFQDVEQFIGYKNKGQLNTAEYVAKHVVTLMKTQKFPSGAWVRLSDLEI